MQSEETFDANSELFKEDVDDAMHKNPYEIRFCDLISVSLIIFDKFRVCREAARPLIVDESSAL